MQPGSPTQPTLAHLEPNGSGASPTALGGASVLLNTCMSLTLTDLLLEEDDFLDHQFHNLQPPPPGDPNLEAWLEQTFHDEDSYGGGEVQGDGSALASGEPWFQCTSWARMVAAAMPNRGRVMGFWIDDNPEATEIAKYCEGHDFAVVDGRYIVDGWAKNVEQMTNKVVFDLQNPKDKATILGIYGNPSKWKPL